MLLQVTKYLKKFDAETLDVSVRSECQCPSSVHTQPKDSSHPTTAHSSLGFTLTEVTLIMFPWTIYI